MSLFEFISGMISVLIALAVAQLLISIGRLAQHHQRVRAYLPHTLWCVAIFLLAFLHWWSLWDFRDLEWNSAMFFYSLLGPLLLFFAVTLLNPDTGSGQGDIDLEAHYGEVRPLFLGVLLAALVFFTFDGPLFGTEDWFNVLRLTQCLIALSLLLAIAIPRRIVQIGASAFVVLILVYGTAVRFLPGTLEAWSPFPN